MRLIAANYIYPVNGEPIRNGYLVVDSDGTIVEVVNTGGTIPMIAGLEYFSGVLVPGFVNAHCHSELSHMVGLVDQKLGMDGFVASILKNRHAEQPVIDKAVSSQFHYMYSRGINGLGDIVNTTDSFKAKKELDLLSYSFVEMFRIGNTDLNEITEHAKNLKIELQNMGLNGSYVPHAPYSVPEQLYKFIDENLENSAIGSFHFREHPKEREVELMQLKQYLPYFLNYKKLLLIHNINLNKEEKLLIEKHMEHNNSEVFWCLCPNSNLYIEDKLPNIKLFMENHGNVCLGTDSLASNTKLSILEEMKTLALTEPDLKFTDLLQWATLNGAKALGLDGTLGSFEPGKKPGVVLLENFDFTNHKITGNTSVKRLV